MASVREKTRSLDRAPPPSSRLRIFPASRRAQLRREETRNCSGGAEPASQRNLISVDVHSVSLRRASVPTVSRYRLTDATWRALSVNTYVWPMDRFEEYAKNVADFCRSLKRIMQQEFSYG